MDSKQAKSQRSSSLLSEWWKRQQESTIRMQTRAAVWLGITMIVLFVLQVVRILLKI